MPSLASKMAGIVGEAVAVVFAVCLRGDDGDFVVEFAVLVHCQLSASVVDSVSVELSCQYQFRASAGRP